MIKLITAILPFYLMREGGEDAPETSRDTLFLNALGLSDEVKAILQDKEQDISSAVDKFKESYSGLLKSTYQQQWQDEAKDALIKDTQNGSHMAFQSKLLKTFQLDADKFKDADKKTEAILQAVRGKIDALNDKLGSKDPAAKQLQEQLDLLNGQYSEAQGELEKLRKLEQDLPTIKEQIIQGERDRAWTEIEVAKALESIENKNAAASLNLVQLLLSQTAKLEVQTNEQGNKSILIKNKVTDAPFMRSATDNYKDLAQFIKSEILERNKLINLQNPPSTPSGTPPSSDHKGSDKPKNRIHPNAQV